MMNDSQSINDILISFFQSAMTEKNIMYIDAWRTTSSNEEGKVIAKINLSNSEVEYVDEKAKTDAYAQTVIRRVLNAVV